MRTLKILFRRLFFYSSRQLWRRMRIYRAVFFTSMILLTLVLCGLELFESFWLRNLEADALGTYHASFLDSPTDHTETIRKDRTVTDVWTIPWTSQLASSDDASVPGKLVVPTEDTDRLLGVHYLWGSPPAEGEIAVSRDLFRSYRWIEAGKSCDFFFKASDTTYRPLRVSGIFTTSDSRMRYVFVGPKTAAAIDGETGAHRKYDTYFSCADSSDRYVAKTVNRLWHKLRLGDTEEQARKADPGNHRLRYVILYEQYLNNSYIWDRIHYAAAPSVIASLPVIAMAALILSSFMSFWTATNAPEYGVLASLGANRRNLCSIAAGQVLLISLLTAPPVVLLSGLITKLYITVYNAVAIGPGFRFVVPWTSFVKVSLWFSVLSCVFTYLGIARITRETPFTLISGSWRGEMPFVRCSALSLAKVRDKVARLALIETFRQIRGEIVQTLVTSIASVVTGIFLIALGAFVLFRYTLTSEFVSQTPTDTVISVPDAYYNVYGRTLPLTDSDADMLRNTPGISSVGTFSFFPEFGGLTKLGPREDLFHSPSVKTETGWEMTSAAAADAGMLSYLCEGAIPENVESLFERDDFVIFVASTPQQTEKYPVGSSLEFSPEFHRKNGSTEFQENTVMFTVLASVPAKPGILTGGYFLFSPAGAERLGLSRADEHKRIYFNFDPSLTEAEATAILDEITASPEMLRYQVDNTRVKTTSEKSVIYATAALAGIFCLILYAAFVVMSVTHTRMKTARSRRDYAIKRQLGADDGEILRETRVSTYPASLTAASLTIAAAVLFSLFYLFTEMADLNIMASRFPMTYTPAYYAQCRNEIFGSAGMVLFVGSLALPMHFVSLLTAALCARFPTKRLLKEPITEGIRKDTD